MIQLRPSVSADVPRQRELWSLAFGDEGAYVDNFYRSYYRPERVLVLEENGVVQAMTAWFDTDLVVSARERDKAGYLYAVATHPDARGRGFAGRLLEYADTYLNKEQGCQAVTTVPAEESLHRFFGANGFRECFTHDHCNWTGTLKPQPGLSLEPLSPARYGQMREEMLAGIPHIAYPEDALRYQAGCCQASGGGLFLLKMPKPVLLCAEGMGDGTLLVKELLGAEKEELPVILGVLPNFSGWYRTPGNMGHFGMLKWLSDDLAQGWNWTKTAYMGLGFD